MQPNPRSIFSRLTGYSAYLIQWLVILAVAIALWVGLNFSTIREYVSSRNLRNQNKTEVTELRNEYEHLVEEKTDLDTWGLPAERRLRERYRMSYPGEEILLIEEPEPVESEPEPQAESETETERAD